MKLINDRKIAAASALTLFLLLLIFSPAQVFAQEGQADVRPPNPDGDLVRQLSLTPDQIEKIKAIREQNREVRRQVVQRIRAAQMALDRAIYVENADEGVVEQRARELAEAQAAQVRLQALSALSIRRILTPEQLETFRTLRQRAETERRNRRLEEKENRAPLRDRRGQNSSGQTDGAGGQRLSPRRLRARP